MSWKIRQQSAIYSDTHNGPCAETSKNSRKSSDFAYFSTLPGKKSGNHPIPKPED
jgi:hypothetical protein